ncbi:hypothetical protein RG47T_0083 [Mucilaginibacter polytrichastri]|uniref:Uncharacterized protein n=1 Tax=Mucilaginibacter polytrichastri TaxID=1302689 RepID=A0A1Q5ZS99_9SPHI|nr:hypothetical protein RG47T_0083 [Mucilaginibacter polytrichastri]
MVFYQSGKVGVQFKSDYRSKGFRLTARNGFRQPIIFT